jgi:hypothetical protein
MRQHIRIMSCFLGIAGLLLGALATGAAASAAVPRPGNNASTHVCSGTAKAPGALAGTYSFVVIHGVCAVDAGPALVRHDLVITKNSALVAVFARNDVTGNGHSRLTVGGNLIVEPGGSLVMGCESKVTNVFGHPSPVFPCVDDPHQKHPTLNSHDTVRGSLVAFQPLGVVVHNSTIRGNVAEIGGGGGVNCKLKGIFKAFKSPAYSDYEDNHIGGSLTATGVRSCWMGAFRNQVYRNLRVSRNRMADPDAMEIATNAVHRNLTCRDNHPAVQFGDSDGHSNRVGRRARGECGFGVILPSPAPEAHLHVKVKFRHISIHLRRR